MRFLRKSSPYLILAAISVLFLIMYVGFFAQAFGEKMTLGVVPEKIGFGNFSFLWKGIPWGLEMASFWEILFNTVLFATVSGATVLFICLLGGYALSRFRFRGRGFLLSLQLMLHAFPGPILFVGVFFLLLYLHLLYTIPGVAIARASMEIPLGIWLAKGFFDAVPWDIERSAMTDGCNRFQAWWKVLLPMIKPGIAALFIWGFLFAWHEFIWVYTFLPGTIKVMSTLIQGLVATEVMHIGVLAAMSIFYMLPPLILFIILQKELLKVPILGAKGV